jgi:DNA-binding NtrC family response regulator
VVLPAIRAFRTHHAQTPILAVLDPSRPAMGAEAMHAGAVDLLPWPFDERDLESAVANVRDQADAPMPEPEATRSLSTASDVLFAHSTAMRQVIEAARSAASGRANVLLRGEPGSGRTLVARAIHELGPDPNRPFISIDCGAGTPDELDRRLFACEPDRGRAGTRPRGAERIGQSSAIYQARGGTLLLTNPVDAPARVQAKLARLSRDGEAVLAERRAIVDLDVRLMTAVDSGFDAALADGRLRTDLCDRLSQLVIEVPPLRQRRDDIARLATHLLWKLSDAETATKQRFTQSALSLLAALPWPGNGRELRLLVETLAQRVSGPIIQLDDVLEHIRLDGIVSRIDPSGTLRDARTRFERDWISAVLLKHHGRVQDAARALGIQRTNLYRKVRQLNLAKALLVQRRSSG